MMTLLILEAVSLALGVVGLIFVWRRPFLRKIALVFTLISLGVNFLTWLVALPATAWLSYKYMDSFAEGLHAAPFLSKAIACLTVLPMMVGGYLMIRWRSSMWQRMAGLSIILAMFAGLFFWGHALSEKENARKQAQAEQVEQERKVAQAERVKVQEQERLVAIEREHRRQQELTVEQARAQAEQQRLATAAAMAQAEQVRLQIEQARRREEEARREAARQAEEERLRLERERQPQAYYATGPSWPKTYAFSVEAVERALTQKTNSTTVVAYATDGVVTVNDNRQIQRVWVNYRTERAPVQVVLLRNGLTVSLCGNSESLRATCEATAARFEVSRFDSQNPQGQWHLKVYGDIGLLKSWSVTLAPVVYHNGTVARL